MKKRKQRVFQKEMIHFQHHRCRDTFSAFLILTSENLSIINLQHRNIEINFLPTVIGVYGII